MHQHRLRFLWAGVAAGALLAGPSLATAAGPLGAGSPAVFQPDFTKSIDKKLLSTSVQGDSARFALPAGFSNIGQPITFKCAQACTIVVQAMVQVEEANPYWAICPQIDGSSGTTGCNWQGIASSASSVYATGNGTYFWTLAAGKHTFQPQVYLSVDGAIDNWSMMIAQYQ